VDGCKPLVRGIHPAAALFLTYQNFVGKLSNKVQTRPPDPALPTDLNLAPHQLETHSVSTFHRPHT